MRVPIIDQDGRNVGTASPPAMLIEAYTDDDGIVWTAPSAWAYFAACRALHTWADRAAQAERILARFVDCYPNLGGKITTDAKAFLDSKMGKTT